MASPFLLPTVFPASSSVGLFFLLTYPHFNPTHSPTAGCLLCRLHPSESFALVLTLLVHLLYSTPSSRRKLEPAWITITQKTPAQSDSWSQDEAGYETDVPDGDMADLAGLLADNVYSSGYYIRHWKELEYTKKDYSVGTTVLLDRIEDQWFQ